MAHDEKTTPKEGLFRESGANPQRVFFVSGGKVTNFNPLGREISSQDLTRFNSVDSRRLLTEEGLSKLGIKSISELPELNTPDIKRFFGATDINQFTDVAGVQKTGLGAAASGFNLLDEPRTPAQKARASELQRQEGQVSSTPSLIAPDPGVASPTPITDPEFFKVRKGETTQQYLARVNEGRGFTPKQTAGLPIAPGSGENRVLSDEAVRAAREEAAGVANKNAEDIFNQIKDTEIDTRESANILAEIRDKLEEEPPSQPSLVDLFNEKRTELGIDVLETELEDLDAQLDQLNANLFVEAEKAEEKLVSNREIGREKGSIQKRFDREKLLLQVERSTVARQINNKLSTLKTVMTLTQQDFSNASTQYNQEYNRAFQLLQLFNTETNRLRDDARANLTTIINLAQDAGKSLGDLSPDMLLEIEKLEVQAGLPSGTITTFWSAKPNVKVMSTTTGTNAAGDQIVTFIYQDPATGRPGIVETVKTSGVASKLVPGIDEDKPDVFLTDENLRSVSSALVKQFGKADALKAADVGSIKINDPKTKKEKNVKLSDAQIAKIKQFIEEGEEKPAESSGGGILGKLKGGAKEVVEGFPNTLFKR